MKKIQFDWDPKKNIEKKKKHKISFEEAKDVFYDDNAILFDDPEHSIEEDRFLIIGRIKNLNICVVSHCYKDKDEIIRIISARKATKKEKNTYEGWQL